MTLQRTYLVGWSIGDKLTSGQANAMDINVTNAADKRAGQTDTIGAKWTMSGIGRIIDTVALAPNADANITVGGANRSIRVTSAVSAKRVYRMMATGAQANEPVTWFCDPGWSQEVDIVDDLSSEVLYTLGNGTNGMGNWCEIYWNGFNWILFRDGHGTKLKEFADFTGSGQLTVPNGITHLLAVLWGGGGSGGIGPPANSNTDRWLVGGGGGAGAKAIQQILGGLSPGMLLDVTVGSGGTGNFATITESDDGDDTVIAINLGAELARAKGGRGVSYPSNADYGTTTERVFVPGGSGPTSPGGYKPVAVRVATTMAGGWFLPQQHGDGGFAGNGTSLGTVAGYGMSSLEGYAGGTPGTKGADSGSYRGGGGGGGGGGGPGGAGGNGCQGGVGNGAGFGGQSLTPGASNANAGANTGAGGGGAGAGGAGSSGGGITNGSGAGGSGRCKFYTTR